MNATLNDTLETERLILRQFRESDTDAYAEMCADAEVMRFLGGRVMNRQEAWRNMAMVLGHWRLRGYGFWAVEEKRTGALVGRVGCWRPEGWIGLEVGWTLARKFWGRGFATEAARASLGYAFGHLNQTRVISLIHPDNLPSIRVAERIGEQRVGEGEVMGIKVSVYAITREEYKSKSER
jgi:RimJ/RimL family protein N-acetyltransferase